MQLGFACLRMPAYRSTRTGRPRSTCLAEELVGARVVLGYLVLFDLDPALADESIVCLMSVSVLRPRKSIFTSRTSRDSPSCTAWKRRPSSNPCRGHEVRQGGLPMTIPAAWKLVCRFLFSSFLATSKRSCTSPPRREPGAWARPEGPSRGHFRVLGHELGDVVRVLEGNVEGPRDILEDGLGLQRAEVSICPCGRRRTCASRSRSLRRGARSRSQCRSPASRRAPD